MRYYIAVLLALAITAGTAQIFEEGTQQLIRLHGKQIPVPKYKPRLKPYDQGHTCFVYTQNPYTGEPVRTSLRKPCRLLKGGGLSWYMNGREV